jgi:dipeptidyl aminopeptidase/acylaminoacyl peptidase
VVAAYAPTDLVYAFENPSNPRVLNSDAVLRQFLGGGLLEKRAAFEDASPANHISPLSPPTLLYYGERDDIVYIHHADLVAERMAEVQRPCWQVYIPWGNHGCDANINGPGGQIEAYALDRFLAMIFK